MELSSQEVSRLREVLTKISFLENLKMAELDELINHMEKRQFKSGETIIAEGKQGDTFFILASGSVGVHRKKSMFSSTRLAVLQKGSYFGEMALIDNKPRNASVVGEEAGELFYLSRPTFDKVLLKNPNIASLIRQTATKRRS